MAYNVADIIRMVQEKDKTTNLTENIRLLRCREDSVS